MLCIKELFFITILIFRVGFVIALGCRAKDQILREAGLDEAQEANASPRHSIRLGNDLKKKIGPLHFPGIYIDNCIRSEYFVQLKHHGMTVKSKAGEESTAKLSRKSCTFSLPNITESVLLFSAVVTTISCYGPHHPKGPHRHFRPEPGSNPMKDARFIRDEEHVRRDLKNLVNGTKTSQMDPEELEFHYFKSHDLDNNSKLDGLEILEALRHTLHDEGGLWDGEEFEFYVGLIDRIFQEEDLDRDGYLSYVEYVMGRKTAKKP